MGPLARTIWRWRWLAAMGAVIAVVAGSYLRWQSEQARIAGLLAKGEAALAAREHGAALEELRAYLDERPHDARARLLAARAARRLRQYDLAAAELQRCRADGGDGEAIDTEFALIAIERGDAAAVPALRARVAEKDDDLSLVILEVLIQYDLNQYRLRDAQQGFNLYLKRRPDDLYALLGRGQLWERFLSFVDAVDDYRRAVAAHPDSDHARRLLAAALLHAGTPAEALEQYHWLIQRFPNDPAARLGLAKCHRELGHFEEALALLDGLLPSVPNDAEALWIRGQLELDRNRPADAEPWLRRADRASPHDRRMVFSLFNCLQALGRTAEAEDARVRLRQIETDLRRLDEIRQQVMRQPTNVALRCEGAKIFLRNGERGEAMRWLEIALRADPSHEEARRVLEAAQRDR